MQSTFESYKYKQKLHIYLFSFIKDTKLAMLAKLNKFSLIFSWIRKLSLSLFLCTMMRNCILCLWTRTKFLITTTASKNDYYSFTCVIIIILIK